MLTDKEIHNLAVVAAYEWQHTSVVTVVGAIEAGIRAALALVERRRESAYAARDQAQAACAAMRESLGIMAGYAQEPVSPPERGHVCGPEGNCDMTCMTWGGFQQHLFEAQKLLKSNPGLDLSDETRKGEEQTMNCPICDLLMQKNPEAENSFFCAACKQVVDGPVITDLIAMALVGDSTVVVGRAYLADVKRQLQQAQAACAAMRAALIHAQGCVEYEEGDISLAWKAIDDPNPGQPVLDRLAAQDKEIVDLKRAIEMMANGEIDIKWEPEMKGWYWRRDGKWDTTIHPTPAAAALAGLEAMEKGR